MRVDGKLDDKGDVGEVPRLLEVAASVVSLLFILIGAAEVFEITGDGSSTPVAALGLPISDLLS